MLVSNDFSMRMLGQLIPQVPGDKREVYDTTFESVIRKIGVHQSFVDISRCTKLTTLPYGCFQMCRSLLYLDVSYTKLNDIRPITENCTALKALNVAGINFLEEGSSNISNLASLEVLILRGSNVNDISWVNRLQVLRSLDLGVLSITSDPVLVTRNLTRLQELLLDCTKIKAPAKIDNQFTLDHASVLRSMPNLRLVNVCESDWIDWVDYIKHVLGRPVCVQPSSRRTLMFEAVAANNFREVHRLLSTGYDIDCRATIADEPLLAKIWRARGTSMKLRAPFFLISNAEEEEHRPTALHFAVYFNSLECVQLLLDNGADLQLSAWFGDVKEVEGRFNENASLSQKQPRRVFTARQLVEGVLQRNVHRLTADMVNKKVAGWKQVITLWYKRLVLVCDAPRGGYRMTVEEMDERIAAMRVEAAAEAEGNDEDAEQAELVSPSAKLMLIGGTKREAPKKAAAAAKPIVEGTEELSDQDTAGRSADEGELDSVEGSPSAKKFVSKRDKIIERKRRLFEWREHGMVEKVVGKPVLLDVIVPTTAPLPQPAAPVKGMSSMRSRSKQQQQSVRASSRESDRFKSSRTSEGGTSKSGWTAEELPALRDEVIQLPLLGAQSHWLESRALVIREREVAYEATVLPGIHKKDAVELAIAAAATLRPIVAKSSSDDPQESESVPASGQNTPGVLSASHTPFVLSPPGTAHRPTHGKDAFSSLAPVQEAESFVPVPTSSGAALLASTASMKRLSSSERRGRFLELLSQRIEDRLNPDI